MSLPYDAPVEEMAFLLNHVTGLCRLQDLPQFEEESAEVYEAVLNEAARFAKEIIAPLNTVSERTPPTLSGGQVTTSPEYRQAYAQFVAAGWNGLDCPTQLSGQGLPHALAILVNEMWHSASMSFALCPLLTAGAIHAIEQHASPSLQRTYLQRLVRGQWTGTMNLTEPQAGSDLAAITTRATPDGDHYRIHGSKIFITYGEHDLAENIVHLVLARLPDAPVGVKGISLFLVPKYLPHNDALGARNDIVCTALEKKVGIHGSPTAALTFGEKDGATGFLIGQPHQGLFYMFTMMNYARLQIGLQGVAVSERSFQYARAYAQTRRQGRTLLDTSQSGQDAGFIQDHPDVRRTLLSMQSRIHAMRALTLEVATELDLCGQSDSEAAALAQQRADLLVPIAKGWCTEQSLDITSMAVQVHGGMGYIEETGVGQLWRDARITTIYEGTTAIQANDFVGRKLLRDHGQAMSHLLADVQTVSDALKAARNPALQQFGQQLSQASDTLQECVDWVLRRAHEEAAAIYFGSVPLLMLAGFVAGGWMMGRSALARTQNQAAHNPLVQKQIRLTVAYGTLSLLPALGLAHSIQGASDVLAQI